MMSSATTPNTQPKLLGDQYKIIQELGAGGMGKIFYGIHILTEQPVAIKMLHVELTSDVVIRDRFLNEAKTLARLEHPNIVQWKNSVEDETGCYLIMQFIEGANVENLIREQEKMSLEDAIPIAMNSLAGLAYVHSKGVVHRDLKPSNILISNDGEVKLADFGIARITGTDRKTQAGMAVGTFLYMSPEQILAGDIDHRTDIYSMGITLFEMLTGVPPFQGDTEFEVCKKHLEASLPSMRKLNSKLPPEIEEILKKATAKDPRKRYQTAEEFLAALTETFPECAVKATSNMGFSAPATSLLLSSLKNNNTPTPQKKGCMGALFWTLVTLGLLGLGSFWLYQEWMDSNETIPIKYANLTDSLPLPFLDAFEHNHGRWPVGQHFGADISLSPRNYRIQTKIGQHMTTACPSLLQEVSSPLQLQLQAQINSKAIDGRAVHGIALFFDHKQNQSQGYYIAIDPPRQKIAISRLQNGSYHYLMPWKKTSALQTDSNEVRILLQGHTLQLFINNTPLPPTTLRTFTSGRACLFVQQGRTDITFRQFHVSRPQPKR